MTAWAGRRVLVTGSTGFKGAWLCRLLLELGAEVTGLALPEDEPSLFAQLGLRERIDQRDVDLRDVDATRAVVARASPLVVFHLAAQALVRAGFADPVGTYASNALGTLHLLEAVRQTPSVRAVVNVTTDKVYGEQTPEPHVEGAPLGGRGPYSASKVCSEVITDEARVRWADARGLGLATARAGNTLGGGDYAADRIVADCVRAAQGGGCVTLRNPGAVRPWQHVLDALWGYLTLAEALLERPGRFAGGWNFGPEGTGEPTVLEVATAILAGLGCPDRLSVDSAPAGPPENPALRLDSGRARAALGWRPLLPAPQALDWTASWYAGWLRGAAADALCAEQIGAYRAALAARAPALRRDVAPVRSSVASPHRSPRFGPSPTGGPCAHCSALLVRLVLDLGKLPDGRTLLPAERRHEAVLLHPVCAWVCDGCLLVQAPTSPPDPELPSFLAALAGIAATGRGVLDLPPALPLIDGARWDAFGPGRRYRLSLHGLRRILASRGLDVVDVQAPAALGSLRVSVGAAAPRSSAVAWLEQEERAGLLDAASYDLTARASQARAELLEFLLRARREGARVAGYGASPAAVTLLAFCGVNTDLLPFVADPLPERQGRWLPGLGMPVLSVPDLLAWRPDYVVLTGEERMVAGEPLETIRAWGGQLVTPLPTLELS